MINKILVEVRAPMLEQTYNVFIPISKTVAQVTSLLEKSIIEFSGGAYENRIGVMLYDYQGNKIEPGMVVKDSGITNGSKLIII